MFPKCYCPSTGYFVPSYNEYSSYNYDQQASSSVFGEDESTVKVTNNTKETARVFWTSIGWSCAYKLYGGYPFVCAYEVLEPGQSATHTMKGYDRRLAVEQGGTFCGYNKQYAGSKNVASTTVKDMLRGNTTCFPDIGGWLCLMVNSVRKIPVVGSAVGVLLDAVNYRC